MAIFYTSDLHLGHKNCLAFDPRPFASVEEMQQELILRWNKKVHSEDTVYILGDIAYGPTSQEVTTFLSCLNGKKVLIQGNHDHKYLTGVNPVVGFEEVHQLYQLKDGAYSVTLCHYPMTVWNNSHRGSIHLYGHVHSEQAASERHPALSLVANAYNVGCMNWNYEPVTLKEILERNKKS